MTEPVALSPSACPDCGHEPGARGRIRHDEFCPRRAKTSPPPSDAAASGSTASAGPAERAPRRRGFDKAAFKTDLAGGIGVTQGFFVTFITPGLREDMLSAEEADAFADAIADEIDASPKLRAFVVKAMREGRHVKLIAVLVAIAWPRMARRGMLGGMAAVQHGVPVQPPNTPGMSPSQPPIPTAAAVPPEATTYSQQQPEFHTVYETPDVRSNGHAPALDDAGAIPPVFAVPQ